MLIFYLMQNDIKKLNRGFGLSSSTICKFCVDLHEKIEYMEWHSQNPSNKENTDPYTA